MKAQLLVGLFYVLPRARAKDNLCGMVQTIMFEDAMKLLESGKVCSLRYVSFDKQRKSGGKLKFIHEAMLTVPRSTDGTFKHDPVEVKRERQPAHPANGTRNFYKCIDGQITMTIRKIHVDLIVEIDGKRVMR